MRLDNQSNRSAGFFVILIGALPLWSSISAFYQYFTTGFLQWGPRHRAPFPWYGSDALLPYVVYFLVGCMVVGYGIRLASKP
jgi:hypothetical protein